MGRGKEVKALREQMGMNRREFCDYFWDSISDGTGLGSGEKRITGLCIAIVKVPR